MSIRRMANIIVTKDGRIFWSSNTHDEIIRENKLPYDYSMKLSYNTKPFKSQYEDYEVLLNLYYSGIYDYKLTDLPFQLSKQNLDNLEKFIEKNKSCFPETLSINKEIEKFFEDDNTDFDNISAMDEAMGFK